MKRLFDFLRSVIPADPSQLLFLAGVVCLVVARGLRWLPVEISPLPGQPTEFPRLMQILRPFLVFPDILAGAAGYFICFWPGAHPVRRILALVFLPTLASLGLLFRLFEHLNEPFSSVLESNGSTGSHRINGAQGMLWNLPQAFQFSLCVTLSFVLAWLTLHSGSVVPAAIAHAVYNILVFSAFGLPFAGKSTLRIALWAVLAYILFRYWTVPEEAAIDTVNVAASSEFTV